jgi:hypothetical protein
MFSLEFNLDGFADLNVQRRDEGVWGKKEMSLAMHDKAYLVITRLKDG